MLKLLLTKLVFDVEAEGHRALVLLAVLCMVAAKSNELLADGAPSVGFAFAAFGVLDNPFHLLAGWQRAVCVAALTGVDEGLNAALDAQPSRLLGALRLLLPLAVALIVQTQAPLNHLVVMALSVVAVNAEVVVLKAKKTQSSVVCKALPVAPGGDSNVTPVWKHALGCVGTNTAQGKQDSYPAL